MADLDVTAIVSELVDAVARGSRPEGVAWLAEQLTFDRSSATPDGVAARPGKAGAFDPHKWPAAFAGAGRRLGTAPVAAPKLRELGLAWPETAGADEHGRAALVLTAVAAMPADRHVAFVRDLIRRGEVRERQAVLRVLAALPDPARFGDIAVDACRTNVQTVFEAIACDNAFAGRYFGDAAFFQMVLKALFVGAPLARVHELAERTTPELVRMVEAYASERRAAGRPVPEDAKLVIR